MVNMTPKPVGSPGLLTLWVARRLGQYAGAERLGVPRGEPIGFSRRKFHAALLTLTTDPLADQAERVGVSYDLLRKWRGESEFKARVADLAAEFAQLVRRMVVSMEAGRRVIWEWAEDGGAVFGDAERYGAPVLDALKHLHDREADQGVRFALANIWFDEVMSRGLDEAQLRPLWWQATEALADAVLAHFVPDEGRAVTRTEAIEAAVLLRDAIAARRRLEAPEDTRATSPEDATAQAEDEESRHVYVALSQAIG